MDNEPCREYVVQAHPGWAVLVEQMGADGIVESLDEDPVIAWRIVSQRTVEHALVWQEPIAAESSQVDTECVLLRPDGRVVKQHDAAWDSKADYLKWLQDEQRGRRAKAA